MLAAKRSLLLVVIKEENDSSRKRPTSFVRLDVEQKKEM